MNVYDTANRLAKELREAPEYVGYKNIKEEISKRPDLKEKLAEFEKLRYDVQLESLKGEAQEQGKLTEMQKMYAELIQDETAKKLTEKILNSSIKIKKIKIKKLEQNKIDAWDVLFGKAKYYND